MKKTVDDINQEFQDFQDELLTRKKKLKTPITFTDTMDDLIDLIDIPPEKKVLLK